MKVITAATMARAEKASIEDGCDAIEYMEKAGHGIAQAIIKNFKAKKYTLLIGKGNNGGDAFVCGCYLIEAGFAVTALTVFPFTECGELCQKQWRRFEQKGGVFTTVFSLDDIVIDGLLGTGFKGQAEGKLKELIDFVNASKKPVVSIDIPSGLNGSTGEAETVIKATKTLSLGMPKVGFYLKNGWDCIGELSCIDFGLPKQYSDHAEAEAFLLDDSVLPAMLPPVKRTRHKYQTGYVVAVAASSGMSGAAQLCSLAALRSGAGIVRLYHPPGMEREFSDGIKELVTAAWNPDSIENIIQETQRAKALLLGPGVGHDKSVLSIIVTLLGTGKPAVVDADGLAVFQEKIAHGQDVVLTPHHGEMTKLLGSSITQKACQEFCEKHAVTVVVKGAPTWIYHPGKKPLIIPRGDPGMAKAGTGDVLTGMIAAFLAQGVQARKAAALSVYIHALSGEAVAKKITSYSLIASDIIAEIPKILKKMVKS